MIFCSKIGILENGVQIGWQIGRHVCFKSDLDNWNSNEGRSLILLWTLLLILSLHYVVFFHFNYWAMLHKAFICVYTIFFALLVVSLLIYFSLHVYKEFTEIFFGCVLFLHDYIESHAKFHNIATSTLSFQNCSF